MEKQALGQAISSVSAFILLALPGYIFTRKKWLTGRQVEGLSSVLVNYLWPVMVLDAMARTQRSAELAKLAAGAGVWALAVILLGGACAWIWTKAGKMKQVPGNILVFAAAFANTGLIGMPLIRLLLGQEALFLAAIMEVVNDVLIFTVGILLIQSGCGCRRQAALGGLLSPGLGAVALGLLLFASGLTLPGVLLDVLDMAAAAAAPMVLFLVGAQLGESDLPALLRDGRAWGMAALRLVLVPGLTLLLWRLLAGELTEAGQTIVLLSAMPSGTCCALFTRQYGGDWQLATRCVMLSTLLCAATVPLWLMVTIL